ncbi:uncharacterized protein LOC126978673 isoform X1 [Leptidea sinapis]|uniref:uncharacterized protein LOC126978673 isoform X1 n=1 Tax=Leptidea sinapis TaxID=189913 RepID=UPI002133FB16|nr:uncharacterized protein LOC126978673 isoform X1 [Leptidea sinapis]
MEPTPNQSLKKSPQGERERREKPRFSILECAKCHDWYSTLSQRPAVGDWHCPSCQRKLNEVAATAAAQQPMKQTSKKNTDLGRGMACAENIEPKGNIGSTTEEAAAGAEHE